MSQESVVHGLPSSQLGAAPGWQLPPPQTSPSVHALLSEQGIEFTPYLHPVLASHVSVVQALPSSQFFGLPPVHALFQQLSFVVHALP